MLRKRIPVLQVHHVEDIVEAVGYVIEEDSSYCLRTDTILQVRGFYDLCVSSLLGLWERYIIDVY